MRRWTMTGVALALALAVGSGGYAQTPGSSTEKMDKDKGMVKKDDSKMMNKKGDVKMMNKGRQRDHDGEGRLQGA